MIIFVVELYIFQSDTRADGWIERSIVCLEYLFDICIDI